MKQITLFLSILFCFFSVNAQTNLSGTYGYSLKPGVNVNNNEKDPVGPSGTLVLQKMEANKYRFWLDVNIGAPSYNLGETDGTLVFVNDTASHDNTFEGAANSCILHFKITGTTITISSDGNASDCGFGNNVSANGNYKKLKTQPVINNAWLKKEYPEAAMIVITNDKSEVFQDEGLLRSYTPKQYFSRGESMPAIVQSETAIYTEYFTPSGKFIAGWIKKSAAKISKTQ